MGISAVPPTNPGAWWFHMITMELLNVIAAAGITPDGTVLTQLKAALDVLYAGGASALQVADFTGSHQALSSPGYQKLPGGLVIQWGTSASFGLDTNNNVVTFPVTFPSTCVAVLITGEANLFYFAFVLTAVGAVSGSITGIVAGAIIMWVTTLAELSSTIVLYYGPWATMTVEIFQRMGSGEFGPASAYAAILIVSVLIPLFFLQRVMGRDLTTTF